jgi:RNA polymerase sigma factor (sigma-70 family)
MPAAVELELDCLGARPNARRVRRNPRKARSKLSEQARAAHRLAATEIAYIAHPAYSKRNAAEWLAAQRPASLDLPAAVPQASAPGVAFVAGLVQERLLTPAEESYLFLQMNYLKHRAEVLRRRLKPSRPDPELIASVEHALCQAGECRDRLVTANLRLVVAVATKLAHSVDMLSDLVSEGLLPLIRAVELFDVSRGHRFSTYATWAVRNQMVRSLQRQRQHRERPLSEEQPGWETIADPRPGLLGEERREQNTRHAVKRLLATLSEREQRVISARFGLNGQPAGQSLSEIADGLGLSKERVRQIILQTLDKLREAAGPQLEDEFGWDVGGEG